MPEIKQIIVIGLGKQMTKDHLPAIQKRQDLEIAALVEPNLDTLSKYTDELNVPGYKSLDDALKHVKPDLAVISIPHVNYMSNLEMLAKRHIHTLKEKPMAMTFDEAKKIADLYQSHKTYLQICVQRRFSNIHKISKLLINEIGRVYSLYAEYTLNLKVLGSETLGWRADKNISGGGAALDLGYHTIDLLTYLFGTPDSMYAKLNYNSLPGDYTIDDSMKAMMTYRDGEINANILTTKIFGQKGERIRIFGDSGFVYIDNRKVTLLNRDLEELESHTFNTKEHEVDSQLEYFINSSNNPIMSNIDNNHMLKDQLIDMKIIDAIYKSDESGKVIKL